MMNALLKFQAQQEELFLNTIHSANFEDIFQANVDFFQDHLESRFNYATFSDRTARAKNPLQQFDDLITYMALYGYAHYQRIYTIIQEAAIAEQLKASQNANACVIDYGCGQGIATLAFIDYLIESNIQGQLKVVLIEPSAVALNRAIHWIQKKAKQADLELELITYCCTFDELDENVLVQHTNSALCFHLLNNILDMYSSGTFSLVHLAKIIKKPSSVSTILAVSPDFFTGNKGFDVLNQLLRPRQVVMNLQGTIKVSEYRYTTQIMSERDAPVRVYIAQI
jgi:SAM-dependent methyltransferase